ncbi:MAG TPA: tetratricopeptide repeat protein [Casimicrobiaceae bacterium]|nr:tetratricopeptide repeat protein [Casimicrobiaceae bacterium]
MSEDNGSPARARSTLGNAELITEAAADAKAGRLGRSLTLLSRRLAEFPNNAELLCARAQTLFDWGRVRESLDNLRAAEKAGLSSFGLHLSIAQACHLLGMAADAEQHARAAIALDAGNADAHFGLAAIFQANRRFDEAIRSYERAYELAPSRVEIPAYIAACRIDEKDNPAVEALVRRAIAADGGDRSMSWTLLGIALGHQGRDDEAEEAFERAEEIESRTGEQADSFVAHGLHLIKCGRVAEAIALFGHRLATQPHPSGHAHYGLALLTGGRYREGWNQYEFRWFDQNLGSLRPTFTRPTWRGQKLDGKTLVLWSEQGHGDIFQFARFAKVLKDKGARIVLLVPTMLKEVAGGFAGVDEVITQINEQTDVFDYQLALMSVPRALGTTLDSIPADVPYLRTDADRVARWRERLGSGATLKVGVAWAGNPTHQNDRHRSIPAPVLGALWKVPGMQFFSLQKERRPGDDACLPLGRGLTDLAPDLHDFVDTAAAIEALDLVIAADTAVAHVAGALGKPCWLLLPANADYRWLRNRDDSPWYPTMRLFRQQRLNGWDEVVARVCASLGEGVLTRDTDASRTALTPSTEIPEQSAASHEPPNHPPIEISQVTDTRYGFVQYSPRQQGIAKSLEYYGEWLQPQLDFARKFLRPGAVVIEAGSGVGAHALGLARLIGETGHLLAYERDPYFSRILEQNLQINKLRNIVTVVRRNLAGLEGGLHQSAGTRAMQDKTEDEVDTVDDLRIGRLDLLKVNESGTCQAILEGASDTLWGLRPILFLAAAHDKALNASKNQAGDFAYRCWRMETALFNRSNFNYREEDIFGGRKALALVALPEEMEVDMALEGCVEL